MVSSATPTLMSSVVPANGMVVMFQTDSRIEGVSATAARNKLPERDPVQDPRQVVLGRGPGPEAGDVTALLSDGVACW